MASGSGTTGSFTMPSTGASGATIVCTFTNAPVAPALKLVKTVDTSQLVVGQTMTYTLTATNIGNVTLTGVTVNDPLLRAGGLTATCRPSTLAPGQSVTCTMDDPYVVTHSDVVARTVHNVATASAMTPSCPSTMPSCTPGGTVTTPPSSTDTPTTKTGVAGISFLPNTGGPALSALGGGLASVLAGAAMVAWSRRRRRTTETG